MGEWGGELRFKVGWAWKGSSRGCHGSRDLKEGVGQPETMWRRAFLAEGAVGTVPSTLKDDPKYPRR